MSLKDFLLLCSFKSGLPLGLSKQSQLLLDYPNINILSKSNYLPVKELLDPNWIAGFISGDGSFGLGMVRRSNNRGKLNFFPMFRTTQLNKDTLLLCNIRDTLGLGTVHISKARDRDDLTVSGVNNLVNKIIPFFDIYRIEGIKALDYQDFRKGVLMLHKKEHFTLLGRDKLQDIYLNMNSFRKDRAIRIKKIRFVALD